VSDANCKSHFLSVFLDVHSYLKDETGEVINRGKDIE
jgi:hypothetical protein